LADASLTVTLAPDPVRPRTRVAGDVRRLQERGGV